MKPDSDNRVVDYLYDDLDEKEREAFAAELESDADAAEEASSFSALLSVYRDEEEELTPSVAATEKLLAQARQSTQPWYARLFGGGLSSLVMRPAVGMAAMAVLVIGVGVFVFLSDQGASDVVNAPKGKDKAPASGTRLAEASDEKTSDRRRDLRQIATGAPAAEPSQDHDDSVAFGRKGGSGSTTATLDGLSDKSARLESKGARGREEAAKGEALKKRRARTRFGLVGGKLNKDAERDNAANRRGPRKSKAGNFYKSPLSAAAAADSANKPSARPSAPPPPVRAAPRRQRLFRGSGGGGVTPQGGAPGYQSKNAKAIQSAPALYNAAQTSLAKGRVAQACALYGSLVRQYRSYGRRADALLGWARCEMSRGAYTRAEQLLRQLMKEHPRWRKAGQAWLVEVKRQRRLAAQRASQRSQRYRKAAPRRPARARPRPADTTSK